MTLCPPASHRPWRLNCQAAGKTVTLNTYPGADHNLSPDTSAVMAEAVPYTLRIHC